MIPPNTDSHEYTALPSMLMMRLACPMIFSLWITVTYQFFITRNDVMQRGFFFCGFEIAIDFRSPWVSTRTTRDSLACKSFQCPLNVWKPLIYQHLMILQVLSFDSGLYQDFQEPHWPGGVVSASGLEGTRFETLEDECRLADSTKQPPCKRVWCLCPMDLTYEPERCVDPLERLWSFVCSAGKPVSSIESAVTVIISDLLTVCVSKSESAVTVITSELLSVSAANLCKIYCSCYLCYVFSCIFVNKPSFSIVLSAGLFTPYTHRSICVTISYFLRMVTIVIRIVDL
ncbi:hypothetical protein AVEN_21791-1 [Araneus ventricosus]|uniref:Uncharacterized protein n=1 Tax=Araneus ventricosus TaxID=182803 RepID=A0A4Y2V0L5_ARAVE|nr:hypothetical protein AVEN_21791-1 [Araneus ventricosus]